MIKYIHDLWVVIFLLLTLIPFISPVRAADFSAGILPKVVIPSSIENAVSSMMVFYPTKAVTKPMQMGLFSVDATLNAPLANSVSGIIIISHGLGGSHLSHRDIAVTLAHEGFVVAAVLHSMDNFQYKADLNSPENWQNRPLEISAAITVLQAHKKFSKALKGKPVGAFGFSRGGYTVLAALGAKPELKILHKHCATNTHDPTCQRSEQPKIKIGDYDIGKIPQEARICAAVLADPLAAIFRDNSLKRIRDIPIQIYLPENENELLAKFHGSKVASLLNDTDRKSDVEVFTFSNAQHFSFLAPFPDGIQVADEIRKLYNGFDKKEFNHMFLSRLVAFFKNSMSRCFKEKQRNEAVGQP